MGNAATAGLRDAQPPRAPAAAKMLQTTAGQVSDAGGPHLPLHHSRSSLSGSSVRMDRNWLGISGWKIALWKSISSLSYFVGNDPILVNFSNRAILENECCPHVIVSHFVYRLSTFFHSNGTECFNLQVNKLLTSSLAFSRFLFHFLVKKWSSTSTTNWRALLLSFQCFCWAGKQLAPEKFSF